MMPRSRAEVGVTQTKGFGCLRGKITMAADIDEPLEAFKDYM